MSQHHFLKPILAGLPALALLCATPAGALAASPVPASEGHDQARPVVMREAAQQVAAAKLPALAPFSPNVRKRATAAAGTSGAAANAGLQKEVFGFGLASSLDDPNLGYPSWQFSLLSTVAYFGLHVDGNGNFVNDSGWAVWNSSKLSSLVNTAHGNGTRVVLTIIQQDSGMCGALSNAQNTITQTVAQVQQKGVDGVNVDYEGTNFTCNGQSTRSLMTAFMQKLRAAMPGSYLTIDTYASSATDGGGFFDVGGMTPYTDGFFVMSYDLEYSNWSGNPANCPSFCLGPTAPIGGYRYNDTDVASQYAAVAGATKVILGVPYYGRKGCVGNLSQPNQVPGSGTVVADTYLDASTESSYYAVQPGTYAAHRDVHDGSERWDTWHNTTIPCNRELYWDDTQSLGQKYDLVNRDGLRGVGIWNLNYGGNASELWGVLATYFSCPTNMTVSPTQATTEFSVEFRGANNCNVMWFDVQQYDTTLNQGWFDVASIAANNITAEGFPGHGYQFRARAHTSAGIVASWSQPAATTVAANAALSHPFTALYTGDAYGGVNPDSSPPLASTAYWPGWQISRAVRVEPRTPDAGVILDGFGGLHPFGAAVTPYASAYWQGWDIARDVAFLPDGSGGYVLDGFGGLHPFAMSGHPGPPPVQATAYWSGWDIARKVVIFDDGTGGYVLDGWGGLHPFGIGRPAPGLPAVTGYWRGWSIARDVALVPGTHSGYTLDGWGGLHPFAAPGQGFPAQPTGGGYWQGWDIARAVWLAPGATAQRPSGYLLDGYGGVHPLAGAPNVAGSYWGGRDIARVLTGG